MGAMGGSIIIIIVATTAFRSTDIYMGRDKTERAAALRLRHDGFSMNDTFLFAGWLGRKVISFSHVLFHSSVVCFLCLSLSLLLNLWPVCRIMSAHDARPRARPEWARADRTDG